MLYLVCFLSERWTREPDTERKRIFPGAAAHSGDFRWSGRKDVIQVCVLCLISSVDAGVRWWNDVSVVSLLRLLCRDSGGETESMLLNETVPQWVIDITVDVSVRKVLFKVIYTWYFCHISAFLSFSYRKTCPNSTKSHSTSSPFVLRSKNIKEVRVTVMFQSEAS